MRVNSPGDGGARIVPITGPLNHIDISVGYPEKSIPFYAAFFEALGYRRWNVSLPEWQGESPTRATWSTRLADGSRFGVEVRPARPESRDRKYDRYEPGPHHLAFHAGSRYPRRAGSGLARFCRSTPRRRSTWSTAFCARRKSSRLSTPSTGTAARRNR